MKCSKHCVQNKEAVLSTYIQNFLKYKPLLLELTGRDIKIKYRRSVLGVAWTLLRPLMMMTVLSVVFSNLFRFQIENFPLYILSGQVIFNFFNDASTTGLHAIIGSKALIKKVYVPKYLFVISRILSSIINLFASFTALLLVMFALRADMHYKAFLAFVPLVLCAIFSLGVGMLLSAVTVKFRDIMHLWSVFTTALMYLTPVIYPLSILPPVMNKIVNANPLTNYLLMFRAVMLNNMFFSWKRVFVGAVEAAVMLVIGMVVFYKEQDSFILNI